MHPEFFVSGMIRGGHPRGTRVAAAWKEGRPFLLALAPFGDAVLRMGVVGTQPFFWPTLSGLVVLFGWWKAAWPPFESRSVPFKGLGALSALVASSWGVFGAAATFEWALVALAFLALWPRGPRASRGIPAEAHEGAASLEQAGRASRRHLRILLAFASTWLVSGGVRTVLGLWEGAPALPVDELLAHGMGAAVSCAIGHQVFSVLVSKRRGVENARTSFVAFDVLCFLVAAFAHVPIVALSLFSLPGAAFLLFFVVPSAIAFTARSGWVPRATLLLTACVLVRLQVQPGFPWRWNEAEETRLAVGVFLLACVALTSNFEAFHKEEFSRRGALCFLTCTLVACIFSVPLGRNERTIAEARITEATARVTERVDEFLAQHWAFMGSLAAFVRGSSTIDAKEWIRFFDDSGRMLSAPGLRSVLVVAPCGETVGACRVEGGRLSHVVEPGDIDERFLTQLLSPLHPVWSPAHRTDDAPAARFSAHVVRTSTGDTGLLFVGAFHDDRGRFLVVESVDFELFATQSAARSPGWLALRFEFEGDGRSLAFGQLPRSPLDIRVTEFPLRSGRLEAQAAVQASFAGTLPSLSPWVPGLSVLFALFAAQFLMMMHATGRRARALALESTSALRRSEEVLRRFFDSTVFLMAIVQRHAEGVFVVRCNHALASFVRKATGRPDVAFRPVGDLGFEAGFAEALNEAMEKTQFRKQVSTFLHECHSGTRKLSFFVTVNAIRTPQDSLRHFCVVIEDRTHEKEMENNLRRTQAAVVHAAKLSSLGEMAGGIAHEINNPLTVVYGRAAQLKILLSGSAPTLGGATTLPVETRASLERGLDSIMETAERVARIVRGLRAFARSGEQDPFEPVSLVTLVHETLSVCQERFRSHGVRLEVAPLPDLTLECRGVQIQQVLLNLLSNAFDAVEGLPTPWVRLEVRTFTDTDGWPAVKVSVVDSGPPLAEGLAAKIMQPFFTTKSVGKGTGLGLSISKGIVEDHQGVLAYEASMPCTTFSFTLPLHLRLRRSREGV